LIQAVHKAKRYQISFKTCCHNLDEQKWRSVPYDT